MRKRRPDQSPTDLKARVDMARVVDKNAKESEKKVARQNWEEHFTEDGGCTPIERHLRCLLEEDDHDNIIENARKGTVETGGARHAMCFQTRNNPLPIVRRATLRSVQENPWHPVLCAGSNRSHAFEQQRSYVECEGRTLLTSHQDHTRRKETTQSLIPDLHPLLFQCQKG